MHLNRVACISTVLLLTTTFLGCEQRRTADEVIESVRASTTMRERKADVRFPIGFQYPENWTVDESGSNQSGPGGTAALVLKGRGASEIRISVVDGSADLETLVAERLALLNKISPRGHTRSKDITQLGPLQGVGQVYRLPIGRLFYRMSYFISQPNERVPQSLWLQVLAPESDESGEATAIQSVLNSITGSSQPAAAGK